MRYLVTTPWWLRLVFPPGMIWNFPTREKIIYLTFDDGPHPVVTPFVLDYLKAYNAKATFFCIGRNVDEYPDIYNRILLEGHRVGNHTYSHLHARKERTQRWLEDAKKAGKSIHSDLFRPPYGHITRACARALKKNEPAFRIVLWDVLSADFDERVSADNCIKKVTENGKPGSIVVFHDSAKAWPRLETALPAVLKYFSEKGFSFNVIV
jgi:peptidoglycan/xylan/chitin deacetylase (PgdA/CDA1 family)